MLRRRENHRCRSEAQRERKSAVDYGPDSLDNSNMKRHRSCGGEIPHFFGRRLSLLGVARGSRSLWLLTLTLLVFTARAAEPARLEVVIRDEQTGRPTPCTVTLVDAAGKVVIERESYQAGFRSGGFFAKSLLPGQTRMRITRGFETPAVEKEIDLRPGIATRMDISLQRRVDLRQRGWYAGDSHVHMIHGEKTIPVDFDFVALTAQAEDLQYLSLAQAWTLPHPSPESLAAELGRRSVPACVLTWNLEAPKNYYRGDAGRCLGHAWCLGLQGRTARGDDVIRLLFDANAHDYESDKPSYANFESHNLIHRQRGTSFYTHPARWWTGSWGGQGGYPVREKMRISNLAVELPLDTLIGPTFDGMDLITGSGEFEANRMAFDLWALLLNHGYRLAATGSSDSCFDRPGGGTPGVARTYTFVPGHFSLAAVAKATAQGRTFVTTGPLLLAALDGQPPGVCYKAGPGSHCLALEAWAGGQDARGLTRLEVLRNGQPFQTMVFPQPIPAFQTNLCLRELETAWYCLRLYGGDPQRQRAISGAFYFQANSSPRPAPVSVRVRAEIVDAQSGRPLGGVLREVTFCGPLPHDGRKHRLPDGSGAVVIPGTVRLRAEAPGYQPLTLSPFLDYPDLVETITRLEADDLVRWETFERIRSLLGQVPLTFRLTKKADGA